MTSRVTDKDGGVAGGSSRILTGSDWAVEGGEAEEEEVGEAPNSPTGSLVSGVHPLYRKQGFRET